MVPQHRIAGSSSDYLIYQADGENEVQRAGDPGELRELHRQEGHHPLGTNFHQSFFLSAYYFISVPAKLALKKKDTTLSV
jgi:hypothetical protein